jgi:hypothetical protein
LLTCCSFTNVRQFAGKHGTTAVFCWAHRISLAHNDIITRIDKVGAKGYKDAELRAAAEQ